MSSFFRKGSESLQTPTNKDNISIDFSNFQPRTDPLAPAKLPIDMNLTPQGDPTITSWETKTFLDPESGRVVSKQVPIRNQDTSEQITPTSNANIITPTGTTPDLASLTKIAQDLKAQIDQFAQNPNISSNVLAGNEPDFNTTDVDLSNVGVETRTDLLEDTPRTAFDLQSLFTQNQDTRDALMKAFQPTEEEQRIKGDILGVREKLSDQELITKGRLLDIAEEPISASAIGGRQENLTERDALKLEVLQREESNLLSRLGLEQEAREVQVQGLEALLGFGQQDIENAFKIQDQIRQEQKDYMDSIDKMEDNDRDALDKILTRFEGLSISDLSPQAQQSLAALASNSGLDFEIVAQGMEIIKNQREFDNLMKIKEANRKAAADAAKISGGSGLVPGATMTPDQLSPIAKMVYDGVYKLSDITATQKAAIAPELQAVGYTTAMAAEDRNTIAFIKNEMVSVMEAWKEVPNRWKGLVQGKVGKMIGGKLSPEVSKFESARAIVGMSLTRLFERGRISDQDRIFYMDQMPELETQKEEVAQASATELIRLLEEKMKNQLDEINTGTVVPVQGDIEYIKSLGL